MARSEARHFEQALRPNNCVDVSHSSLIKDAVNSYPNGPQSRADGPSSDAVNAEH